MNEQKDRFIVMFTISQLDGKYIHSGKFNYYDTKERRAFAERSLEALKAGYIVKTCKE